MEKISKYNVVHHLRKRSLLIAINGLAGLSIFFFGYDQVCLNHTSVDALLKVLSGDDGWSQ
jgi:hypothetical protein